MIMVAVAFHVVDAQCGDGAAILLQCDDGEIGQVFGGLDEGARLDVDFLASRAGFLPPPEEAAAEEEEK